MNNRRVYIIQNSKTTLMLSAANMHTERHTRRYVSAMTWHYDFR